MRILIAEDERITRTSLKRQLESWGHEVVAMEDGELAWEQFSTTSFDIVITDWEMPRVSGIELIQRIRQAAAADAARAAAARAAPAPTGSKAKTAAAVTTAPTFVYIIMLTSRSDKSDIVKGIEGGADDFVSKPFDKDELRVRLLAGERIVTLERTLSRQNHELRDANARIHHGLRAAARVQKSMLPESNITTPHVQTAWNYVPTDELAGDALGLHLLDERYLISYVIDVSGHGVPAALLSVSAMHALEPSAGAASLLREMGGADGLGTVRRPARVALGLNQRFRAGENDGRYMTMVLTVLDTHTGKLHFVSAGHPAMMILRGDRQIAVPDIGGLPIAVLPQTDYEDGVLQLAPGDRVFLFSDGVLEQTPPESHAQFDEERLLPLLQAGRDGPLQPLVEQVVEALAAWAQSKSFTDDVTLVALEWRPTA